jgi:predicted MPP superfamily phosphohydrolase
VTLLRVLRGSNDLFTVHKARPRGRPQIMKTFFDLLIALLIIITAYPAVILLYSRKKRLKSWEYRHHHLSLFFVWILIIGFGLTIYGSFIEPKTLVTNYQTIDLPNLDQPLKIAFVTDLQVGKYKQTEWTEKVVERILKLNPDLVLLGGDQIDNEHYDLEELDYLRPLAKLTTKLPVYAINGNHEYGLNCFAGVNELCHYTGDLHQEIEETLTKLGIKYLTNNLEKITINSSSFYLFGGDEYWAKKLDLTPLNKRTEKIPTIALIHNPTGSFTNKVNADLILSGHTHGGQVRLPIVGPLGLVDTILPREYYWGWHEITSSTKMFVSSGAGETGARARLLNPPEVVLLTIK